jgi:hypothetical protein
MRLVVVTEVEQLVFRFYLRKYFSLAQNEQLMEFRKNVGLKAYRYAVHFLSQIQLRAGEWELATK